MANKKTIFLPKDTCGGYCSSSFEEHFVSINEIGIVKVEHSNGPRNNSVNNGIRIVALVENSHDNIAIEIDESKIIDFIAAVASVCRKKIGFKALAAIAAVIDKENNA